MTIDLTENDDTVTIDYNFFASQSQPFGPFVVNGLGGNDTFMSTLSPLTLYGGAGDDTYIVSPSSEIHELAGEGTDTIKAAAQLFGNLPDNVENLTSIATYGLNMIGNSLDNVIAGSGHNDQLDGLAGNDTLDGGAGDDRLIAGPGSDTLIGGTGNDTYVFSADSGPATVVELADGGVDTISMTGATFSLAGYDNVENLVSTNPTGGATLSGNGLANRITGSFGDDILYGGGNDTLAGGYGSDTYHIKAGDVVVESNIYGSLDVIYTDMPDYVLADFVENLFATATTGVTFTGNAENNEIQGANGNDVVSGMDGDDTLTGLAGNDRLSGDAGNDTLDGGDGDDTLVGGDGDDVLIAGGGMNFLEGGYGNDIYVGIFSDAILEDIGGGIDTIRTARTDFDLGNYTRIENIETMQDGQIAISVAFFGNDLDNRLTGGGAHDTLLGGNGNDVLDGMAGADTLTGGMGDDIYIIDDGGDTITESEPQGTDSVRTNLQSYVLADFVEILIGTSDSLQSLTGNSLANTISAGDGGATLNGAGGDDVLEGGFGDDKVYGGDGNDTLSAGHGIDKLDGGSGDDTYLLAYQTFDTGDTVTEGAGDGQDTIVYDGLSFSLLGFANVENLTITSAGGGSLEGNALANRLMGGDGSDLIYGGGNDTLVGGQGGDQYWLSSPGDVIVEDSVLMGGSENDAVVTSINGYVLASNVENLGTLSTTGITLSGNGLGNQITGNTGNDMLFGRGGNDYVEGGNGHDLLQGGFGGDHLTGGTGKDIFVYALARDSGKTAATRDVIADFKHLTDKIDVSALDASGKIAGNQAFKFIGQNGFHKVAGEVHFVIHDVAGTANDMTVVEADWTGDGTADFQIKLAGAIGMSVIDFVL